MNDIIDIGLESFDVPKASSSSGGGLEFLMNPNSLKKSSSMGGGMNLGDLNKLESELNDLTTGAAFSGASGASGAGWLPTTPTGAGDSKIGEASGDYLLNNTAKTWDGYTKMTEIPVDTQVTAKLTGREQSKKKRIMLKRLEEWQKKGYIQATSFNMDSPYEDIEDEYETVMEDRRKQESVKLQKHWFLTGINTIEFFNGMFNPFDLDLTGWGEKMSEDVDDDDELFGELYEKYKGGKLAPEVSLLLRVATSAFLINMTNKMVSSATPGLSDVLRQSPDLMNAFMKATVDSLNQAGPDPTGGLMMGGKQPTAHPLAAFAKDMFSKEFQPNMSQGLPPPPVESKVPPKSTLAGRAMQFTQSRPDLNQAATAVPGYTVGGRGVEVTATYGSLNEQQQQQQQQQPISNFSPPPQQLRPEMKGPSSTDLDSILAGLKKKESTDIPEDVSVVSMRDLDSVGELSSARSNRKKTTGRKKPSQRVENSISIDL